MNNASDKNNVGIWALPDEKEIIKSLNNRLRARIPQKIMQYKEQSLLLTQKSIMCSDGFPLD